jgi:HEAT repeat protein
LIADRCGQDSAGFTRRLRDNSPMENRRRNRIAFGLAAVALAFLFLLRLSWSSEPTYHGRRISYWLGQIGRVGPQDESIAAVKGIGAAGLPWILSGLQAKDSRLKKKLLRLAEEQVLVEFDFSRAEEKRGQAMMAIRILGPAARDGIPAMGSMLEDPELALGTAEALGSVGPDAVQVLAEALTNRNTTVRTAALSGLWELGTNAEPAVAAVSAACHDPDVNIQRKAVEVLGAISLNKPESAFPALIETLHAGDPMLRAFAVHSLASLGKDEPDRVLALVMEGLEDSDAGVRGASTMVAVGMGERAKAAVPKLLEMLNDPDETVPAALALREILGADCVLPIARALTNQIPQVQARMILMMARFETNAEPAVPILVDFVNSTNPAVRSATILTLGRIRCEAGLVVPRLIECLTNENPRTQHAAAASLAAFGTEAAAAVPLLRELAQKELHPGVTPESAQAPGTSRGWGRIPNGGRNGNGFGAGRGWGFWFRVDGGFPPGLPRWMSFADALRQIELQATPNPHVE